MSKQKEEMLLTYPIGTRVKLIQTDDVQAPLPGTLGTIINIDDIGNLIVPWDGGLAIDQDEKELYSGASLPVNDLLESIFLQLRISERSVEEYQKLLVDTEKNQLKLKKIEL